MRRRFVLVRLSSLSFRCKSSLNLVLVAFRLISNVGSSGLSCLSGNLPTASFDLNEIKMLTPLFLELEKASYKI